MAFLEVTRRLEDTVRLAGETQPDLWNKVRGGHVGLRTHETGEDCHHCRAARKRLI